jgi:hypothetical protein
MNSQSVSQSVSMMSQQRFSWFDSRKQSLDSQSLHHSDLDRLQVGLKNGKKKILLLLGRLLCEIYEVVTFAKALAIMGETTNIRVCGIIFQILEGILENFT